MIVLQRQTQVTAYFTSKQLLLFVFDVRLRRTAVSAYYTSKQLLLFVFARYCTVPGYPNGVITTCI